ncbi:MAG: ArnT family glycosyltransferase [Patescibacteria group bacterium]
MGKIALKIREFIRGNKKEAEIVFLILSLALILRIFKIDEYMTFLGDEGRDAIVVRRLLAYADPILIGPGTSIGNMYLGPLYYYLMAPALFLARYSPVGPAVQIALLSVVTTFLVWYLARGWFGKKAAIISSLFYAIAPTVIVYARSSWNPNIMPFFSLLTILGIWRFWHEKKFIWLPIVGISMAFVLQSHYLGLLLLPTIGLFWLLSLKGAKKENKLGQFVKYSLLSLVIFSLLMSPLVIFDARHGWRNFAAIRTFFTERQTTVSARPWKAIPKFPILAENISTRLLGGRDVVAGKLTFYSLLILAIYLILKRRLLANRQKDAFFLTSVWIFFALIGLGLYKQEIYDHYYGFFFAAPFLLLGGVVETVLKFDKKNLKVPIVLGLIMLGLVNFGANPLKYPPVNQLARSKLVAEKILAEAQEERFNLAVIAERNYEDGYQYFLEVMGAEVVDIDAQRPETITEQLFAVCEMPKEKCQPTTNPKAEVANFGWSKIEGEWEVSGVGLYKLVHTK